MLTINDTTFDRDHLDSRFAAFARAPELWHSHERRYAVCTPDAEALLTLCLYLRHTGASVAPLHPSTPLGAAKRTAQRLRCETLLFHGQPHEIARDGDAPKPAAGGALLQLSSGTTGEPKCVERSWSSVDREVENYVAALGELGSRTPLLACPVTHSYGFISGVLAALRRGITPVVLTDINPKYVLRRATADQHALLYASPTLLHVLVRLLGDDSNLCAVMTSGAPLRAAWFEQLKRRSSRVLQQYGCSELGCISLNLDTHAAGEVGAPLAHLQLSAGAGPAAPEEILVRVDDRVFGTRDLGYFNERGLCFVNRMDDTINVAGVNVYPGEVEEVVLEFEGVDEAAVYKRQDPYAGERVCLKFTSARSIDVSSLRRFCSEQLSRFAVPLEIQQVASIPKRDNGKLDRRQLAELEDGLRA